MPDTAIWNQFPVVAVIILFLAVIGGGVFAFARWAWKEYSRERDKDRLWREQQNAAREASTEKQNTAWQQTVKELAEHWEEQDRDRESVLKDIAAATAKMLEKLDRHDERAARIEQATTPRPQKRREG